MSEVAQEFKSSVSRAFRIPMVVLVASAVAVLIPILMHAWYTSARGSSDAVQTAVSLAERHIADMESAGRRFFVSGDTTARDAFDPAAAQLKLNVDDLTKTVSSDRDLKIKVDTVAPKIDEWTTQTRSAMASWSTASGAARNAGGEDVATRDSILKALDDIATTARGHADQVETIYAGTFISLGVLALILIGVSVAGLFGATVELTKLGVEMVGSRDSQIDSLRKNRALLITTMNSVGEGLVATDATGRITFMNPIAERLTGWQESDAVGKEAAKVVMFKSEKTQDSIDLPITQVLKNNIEKEIAANVQVAARDGALKPIAGHAVPIWDDAGKVAGTALIFRDITERRGAREAIKTSEAHKEAIIENALECVIMADHEGRIIEYNAAAEATFGFKRNEAIGQLVGELIVPVKYRDKHYNGFQNFVQTGTPHILGKRVELTGLRKGGEEFPLELAITQVPRQNPPVFATFLRDISDRKAAEAALVAAKEVAEAESRDKSQFLNNMSDELRTPLNAVIGYSEMLQEEIMERRPAEMIPDLKKINDAGRHLLMLITDVLDLARIEAGKMEIYADNFDVMDLVEEVNSAAAPFAARNNNRFRVACASGLGAMHSDKHKIRQCLLYLVNNASKFARDRDLELRIQRNGKTLQFRMSDLSPGISEETSERLVEAFASSANSSSIIRFGGHGLGLVIARHMCQMMGGELVGARQVGHSPTYTITLPDKI